MEQKNTNYGRDQIIINQPQQVNTFTPVENKRPLVFNKLLGVVKLEVDERISQSLHKAVNASLLNLDKELQSHQVSSPWSMEVRLKQQPPQTMPKGTTIEQIWEQETVDRKLLILGEPGSGKTTTMLELAQSLVRQALEDEGEPVPVLLNLSSWKDTSLSIFDWMVLEIKSKYGLRKDLGKRGLVSNLLLPLLDGLDEVAPGQQQECAVAINQLLDGDTEHRPLGLVLCCRLREYEQIVNKQLYLKKAVVLKPLSRAHILSYLDQFNITTIWDKADRNPRLQELLQKPLFLSIFGFVAANDEFDILTWDQKADEGNSITYLLDCYWDTCMRRELVDQRTSEQGILSKTYGQRVYPDRVAIRRALVFLAKAEEKESFSELLIEQMQPAWLMSRHQKWEYRLITRLIFLLILALTGGLIVWLSVWLIDGWKGILIGGLNAILILALTRLKIPELKGPTGELDQISSVQAFPISISREGLREIYFTLRTFLSSWFFNSLFFGLFFGLPSLLFGWLMGELCQGIDGLIIQLVFGMIIGLTFGQMELISRLETDLEKHIQPNQGIKNARRNMVIFCFIFLGFHMPLIQLLEKILASKDLSLIASPIGSYVFFLGLLSFIGGGGRTLIQHIALRIVMARHGYAPFRYDRLLDYCTERLLLQRIGGRYQFMHKYLQEHFAKMEIPSKV